MIFMDYRRFDLSYIDAELKKIGKRIPESVEIILIGGANMIYRGLKAATKDVDIVVARPIDLNTLSRTLKEMDYIEIIELPEDYQKLGTSFIMRNSDGFQCDVFYRQVCQGLVLSPRILERAERHGRFGNLLISLMSPEDLFLFKSITERELDLDDMRILVESGVNWDTIFHECQKQSGYKIWEAFLSVKLEELQEKYGIQAPIYQKLRRLTEHRLITEAIISFIEEGKTYRNISEYIQIKCGCSDSWIRKHVSMMQKEGLLKRERAGGTYRYYKKSEI